ncbi:ArsR family transcriptional regulator [Streptomyces sp. NPDC004065]|uniref:ArsR family transcriptional regulator n=1 Tax=Streptomyces sp. NPDC004065 TaxID=3364689 RepID=UPI00384FA1CC
MLKIPAGRTRLLILEWLSDPPPHAFPRWSRGDPAEDGVTARDVAAGLGIPRRAAEAHLGLLSDLGLLRTRRIGRRTYYRRDEFRIAETARLFEKGW